jgi:hypothetical protein
LLNLSRSPQQIIGLKVSLYWPQERSTVSYPEPDESIPHPPYHPRSDFWQKKQIKIAKEDNIPNINTKN